MGELLGSGERRRGTDDVRLREIIEAAASAGAEAAAKRVVRETFKQFGVDVDDAEQVREFMSDLLFVRAQRVGAERFAAAVKKATITAVIGAMLSGLGYVLHRVFNAKGLI